MLLWRRVGLFFCAVAMTEGDHILNAAYLIAVLQSAEITIPGPERTVAHLVAGMHLACARGDYVNRAKEGAGSYKHEVGR